MNYHRGLFNLLRVPIHCHGLPNSFFPAPINFDKIPMLPTIFIGFQ